MTRRPFVAAGMAVPAAAQDAGEPDLAALIGEADLICDKPAPRSEEGMPIGNGRMGTLVWTAPESFACSSIGSMYTATAARPTASSNGRAITAAAAGLEISISGARSFRRGGVLSQRPQRQKGRAAVN